MIKSICIFKQYAVHIKQPLFFYYFAALARTNVAAAIPAARSRRTERSFASPVFGDVAPFVPAAFAVLAAAAPAVGCAAAFAAASVVTAAGAAAGTFVVAAGCAPAASEPASWLYVFTNVCALSTFVAMIATGEKWFQLGFTDDDLSQLQQLLIENPKAGDVMQGTGGLRKVRFSLPDSGKSGGVRICYIDIEGILEIHLLDVF